MALLNENGQRWVPIIDPPIHIKPGYESYDTGIAQDVFVKDITGNPYIGQVMVMSWCYINLRPLCMSDLPQEAWVTLCCPEFNIAL